MTFEGLFNPPACDLGSDEELGLLLSILSLGGEGGLCQG